MTSIDLNSDLGEGFSRWTLGDDRAILDVVSSANIACGFHAGDARIMLGVTQIAAQNKVSVGAHVSYRDLPGFGRRKIDVDSADLVAEIIYQIGALQGIAAVAGTAVTYVKPHGALYHAIFDDERQATDVVTAVKEIDDSLVLLGLPGSLALQLADQQGLPTAREAFADRAYTPTGQLVPRSEPNSVLHDPTHVADRMLRLVEDGKVTAVDGSTVKIDADSICVHGDTEGAVDMAATVRQTLTDAGVTIQPFTA